MSIERDPRVFFASPRVRPGARTDQRTGANPFDPHVPSDFSLFVRLLTLLTPRPQHERRVAKREETQRDASGTLCFSFSASHHVVSIVGPAAGAACALQK